MIIALIKMIVVRIKFVQFQIELIFEIGTSLKNLLDYIRF